MKRSRRTIRRSPVVAIALLVAIASVFAVQGTALAVQVPILTSTWVPQLPDGPDSPIWRRGRGAMVPLTTQTVALPRLLQVSVSRVVVHSVNDGNQIAILMEWLDPTRDVRATRVDEFRDAAAILFPVGVNVPNVCMGVPGQLTNLWHWKADWQEDLDRGFQDITDTYPNFYTDGYPFATGTPPFRAPADFSAPEARLYLPGLAVGNPLAMPRTSPVEELLAQGFGTASHKPQQLVNGRGVWADGRWRVMFVRPLTANDQETTNLAGRSEVPVSFAVWNGSNGEVGARKQLSNLITMRIQGSSAASTQRLFETTAAQLNTPPTYFVIGFGVLIGLAALAGSWAQRTYIRQARQAGQQFPDGR
jgi:hypothetical protein